MKNYHITLEYENQDRNEYGYPVFGTTTITVYSINQDNAIKKLNTIFGKHCYHILDIEETLLDVDNSPVV